MRIQRYLWPWTLPRSTTWFLGEVAMEIKSNKRNSAPQPAPSSGVRNVKCSACTSVWGFTRCCGRELRECFSITKETADPGPYLPCGRHPCLSPLHKGTEDRGLWGPGLATDRICEAQSLLKCPLLISVQLVSEAHNDKGIESPSKNATCWDLQLLKRGDRGAKFLSLDSIFTGIICP